MAFKMCSANSGVYTAKASVLIKQAISSFALGLLLETLKVDSFKTFLSKMDPLHNRHGIMH